MSLKTQLQQDVKIALKAQEKQRLGTLRLITAAIKQIEVDQRVELGDEEILVVMEKMLKQRKESVRQFEAAGRDDLVAIEVFEIGVIEAYMPEKMGDDEIKAAVDAAIAASGAETMKDMGKVMGILKPQLQGKADMSAVSAMIKSSLSG